MVRGVDRAAIAARAGAERAEQVDFREKLQRIARPHGAGLHEVLTSVAGEACAHKDIEYVVDVRLGLGVRDTQMIRKRTRKVGMAAMVVLIP